MIALLHSRRGLNVPSFSAAYRQCLTDWKWLAATNALLPLFASVTLDPAKTDYN
jgi:hypothetical protein